MLDLDPKHLAIIQKIISRYAPEMKVWAFGSRIKGQAHQGSDLDLVIINPKQPDLAQTQLIELRAALRESNLPIIVDIVDWARIPKSFQDEIQKQHETIPL